MRVPFFEIGDQLEIEDKVWRVESIRNDSCKVVYYLCGVHFCEYRYIDETGYFDSLV